MKKVSDYILQSSPIPSKVITHILDLAETAFCAPVSYG